MVPATQWDGELVANLSSHRAALREPKVMRVRGVPPADEASLLSNQPDMVAVTDPPWLWQRQRRLVDRLGSAQTSGLSRSITLRRGLACTYREAHEFRPEGLLDLACIGWRQSVLIGHAALCPARSVIGPTESVDFRHKPTAQFRRRLAVEQWRRRVSGPCVRAQ